MVRMGEDRAKRFWQRAIEAESKARAAREDEIRRAWEIIAPDWNLLAEREERRVQTNNERPIGS
jgi:hypothetical protein